MSDASDTFEYQVATIQYLQWREHYPVPAVEPVYAVLVYAVKVSTKNPFAANHSSELDVPIVFVDM